MNDRTTKILLALIATGLWANTIATLSQPKVASAQDATLTSIDSHLARIDHDVHNLADIEDGTCRNSKICR